MKRNMVIVAFVLAYALAANVWAGLKPSANATRQEVESDTTLAVVGTLDIESGGAFKIGGTAVSSSAAELNILDGVTATAAEINAVTGASLTGSSTTSAADALAIPVTHRIVQKTTGADAEALTLANGVAGQRLTVILVADGGGDGTLAPATATGFVSVVLAAAGDHVTFEYVDDTIGWIILGAAGVAAPPAISLS